MGVRIRDETPADAAAISALVTEAFAGAAHSSGTEAAIVEKLRDTDALTVSLLAVDGEILLGHVAISPVSIAGSNGWYGLGPVSVRPENQRNGIGSALIRAALQRIEAMGADGCVVVGEPDYYGRFGFVHRAAITLGEVPPPYLQALAFRGTLPTGEVHYHPAFAA